MMAAFVDLERGARKLFRLYTVPEDVDSSAVDRMPLGLILNYVQPETRSLFKYLSQVRNGIAHGQAPKHNRDEGSQFIEECQVEVRAISGPDHCGPASTEGLWRRIKR